MNSSELVGKKFKWISPITEGETFGEIKKVYEYRNDRYPLIETTENNVYPLNECFVMIENEFKKIELDY